MGFLFPRLDSCCCGLDLRVGSLIILWVSLILSIFAFPVLNVIVLIFGIIPAAVGLYGAYKNEPGFLLPWIVVSILRIIFWLLLAVATILSPIIIEKIYSSSFDRTSASTKETPEGKVTTINREYDIHEGGFDFNIISGRPEFMREAEDIVIRRQGHPFSDNKPSYSTPSPDSVRKFAPVAIIFIVLGLIVTTLIDWYLTSVILSFYLELKDGSRDPHTGHNEISSTSPHQDRIYTVR